MPRRATAAEGMDPTGHKRTGKAGKAAVRERVILAAAEAFRQRGVKQVRMDDIATRLSVSKRTLYELFHDKEDLLLDVVKLHNREMRAYMEQVVAEAGNVLEVILRFYEKNATDIQQMNRTFFEDMHKYPKVSKFLADSRRANQKAAMAFYRKGVGEGIFRGDVNYGIVQELVNRQIDLLLQSDLCRTYPLAEVYETFIFMHMRGISTEKGLKIVNDFLSGQKHAGPDNAHRTTGDNPDIINSL